MTTTTEFNVLKVMASKERDWNWMNLDRELTMRNVPGFSQVVEIVNRLASDGLVNIEDSGNPSMPYYRVSQKGLDLLKEINEKDLADLP
ncbi:MarR family transcriptional regulator [Cronobacter turicensis]|nr:MarR family transcriptional regulator [Cronobacter turicensis]